MDVDLVTICYFLILGISVVELIVDCKYFQKLHEMENENDQRLKKLEDDLYVEVEKLRKEQWYELQDTGVKLLQRIKDIENQLDSLKKQTKKSKKIR